MDRPVTSPEPESSDSGARAGGARTRGATSAQSRLFSRSRDDRIVFGIAGGLAARLGVDAILIRLGFAALTSAAGFGIALYLLAWPLSDEADPTAPSPPRPLLLPRPQQIAAIGCVVLGALLVLRSFGLWLGDTLVWPIALAAAGSALIWARSDDSDRARWTRAGARLPGNPVAAVFGGPVSPLRIVVGGVLVAAGMAIFLAANQALAATRTAVFAVAVTAVGLGMILGPWILRLGRQAAEERRQRIRSEERAEIGAHLHDSVLHTLALIQRADALGDVVSLARRQERELRAWLGGRSVVGGDSAINGAIDAMASRVEEAHHLVVDTVVVGDAPLDDRGVAIVLACQEAAVNAARHSGAERASVYVEVEADVITAYVRDQGRGFDPDAIPTDRRGIEESIVGRMRRHGGTATIQSRPGEGSEVQLRMPRNGP